MKKTTTIRIYLLTLFIIFLTSLVSMLLLYKYMDPEVNLQVAYITMGIASFLTTSSFFALILYFFKKVYYRGEVFLSNINSSLRQGIFMSSYLLGLTIFISVGVYNIKTALLLLISIVLLELIFQSFSRD